VFIFVFASDNSDVIAQTQKGRVNLSDYSACLNRAKEFAAVVFRFYRTEIQRKYVPESSIDNSYMDVDNNVAAGVAVA